MFVSRILTFSAFSGLLILGLSLRVDAQGKGGTCGKPEITRNFKASGEDGEKLKIFKAVGTVALLVSEQGHVIDGKVLSVSPEAARESLLRVSKTAEFKPRPGCGSVQVAIVFMQGQPPKLKN
jgi:hypothetical protein